MPAIIGTAPGKIILFGEHAVVYGRPAIAVPVTQVRARVAAFALPTAPPGQVQISARDINLATRLDLLPETHPLALAIHEVANAVGVQSFPAMRLDISSTIPIASGLGSSAAITVAIARAVSAFLGHPLSDSEVSEIAFHMDQQYHGNPSGIDNTVITYAQPVFYIRGQPFTHLRVHAPFTVVIGNTGISSSTGAVVGDVRCRWQTDNTTYERLFDQIGEISKQARSLIEHGPVESIGPLMMQNHALLQQLDVSSPQLDRLVAAAVEAGASGAKLCGGGRGGNMIAMAVHENAEQIASAMKNAGAVNTIITTIEP